MVRAGRLDTVDRWLAIESSGRSATTSVARPDHRDSRRGTRLALYEGLRYS
jgi:hypothetical protein